MRFVEPKVFLVGYTEVNLGGLQNYLKAIDAEEWYDSHELCGKKSPELLVEVEGRLCYRSFTIGKEESNPNVTRIRSGNANYIRASILDQKHGSVLEHVWVNFIFHDVSRVFTHELVRHRNSAISQESLRYVRLNKLKAFLPLMFRGTAFEAKMKKTFEDLEDIQQKLAEASEIEASKDFSLKKKLTSAFRRMAPLGLCTTIGWSTNIRNLRFIIELRTDESAEEEIRLVFSKVYFICKEKFPAFFQDATETLGEDGVYTIKFANYKV